MNTEPELLADEPVRLPRQREPRPERAPRVRSAQRRWWWVLAVVLVAMAGVGTLDESARSRENAQVSRCESQLRLATGRVERRLGLVNSYLEPTLSTDGRVQQLHLADLMSARAHEVLTRVQRADRFCRGVRVEPWHFSLAARQGASTAYSAALLTLVQIVAAQGHVPFRADATLQRLREAVGIDGG